PRDPSAPQVPLVVAVRKGKGRSGTAHPVDNRGLAICLKRGGAPFACKTGCPARVTWRGAGLQGSRSARSGAGPVGCERRTSLPRPALAERPVGGSSFLCGCPWVAADPDRVGPPRGGKIKRQLCRFPFRAATNAANGAA